MALAHRRTEAKRQRCGGAFAPGRRRGKTARPRAHWRQRRRLIWSARLCTIVSITRCAVRQWRITATADRTAPEAFLPAVACRGATSRSAPATPSSLRRPCGGSPGGPWVGDLFAAW